MVNSINAITKKYVLSEQRQTPQIVYNRLKNKKEPYTAQDLRQLGTAAIAGVTIEQEVADKAVRDWENFVNGDIVAKTSYYSQTSLSDWVRIEVPFTTGATTTSVWVYVDSDGQGNGDFYAWGTQLEQGSYATSYIPTNGQQKTRSGEVLPFPSVFEFGSLGAGESGTFFIEGIVNSLHTDGRFNLLSQGGSGTWFWESNGNFYIRTTGNDQAINLGRGPVQGETYKIGIRKDSSNDVSVFLNGELKGTTSISTDNFQWATHLSQYQTSQSARIIVEFPKALIDEELQRLTSPSADATTFTELANNNGYTIL